MYIDTGNFCGVTANLATQTWVRNGGAVRMEYLCVKFKKNVS